MVATGQRLGNVINGRSHLPEERMLLRIVIQPPSDSADTLLPGMTGQRGIDCITTTQVTKIRWSPDATPTSSIYPAYYLIFNALHLIFFNILSGETIIISDFLSRGKCQ